MSRRPPNPSADRAEANRATLKALVKVESNKTCADCKKNKHPRWASWNLGIFICIRCSGIHRGMGTHISRVKSVDLDSWTDEQLSSMLKWGNSRANKYWEAKLAPGHVPSETKIENFIRTKYDSKRWVMDGGMPDPSTLGDADDDVPAGAVQQKSTVERAAPSKVAGPSQTMRAPARPAAVDLMGGDAAPQRPSTTEPVTRQPPSKGSVAPPKQTAPGEALLGLDFLGGSGSAPPARPASSSASTASAPPRTDLKQSILSLYASAPKPAAPQQSQHQHSSSGSFSGFQAPGDTSSSGLGGVNDAFSSLSFSSNPSPPQQPAAASPFASLTGAGTRQQPPAASASAFGGGGSFFDPPAAKAASPPKPQRSTTSNSGFGDFFSATSPAATSPPLSSTAGGGGNLFDFSTPSQPAAPAAPKPASDIASAFNLSQPSQPAPRAKPAASAAPIGGDPWGASSDVWASSGATETSAAVPKPAASNGLANDFGGWNDAPAAPKPAPQVTQDDDFGGWSSAPAPAPAAPQQPKPSGGFSSNSDDLFSNVWQ